MNNPIALKTPTTITCALSWDAENKATSWWRRTTKGGNTVDLDLSAVVVTGKTIREVIYFGHLTSDCHNISHHGDNRTGHGDGPDETISLKLTDTDPDITAIWLTINSYNEQPLDQISQLDIHLASHEARPTTIADQPITNYPNTTALAIGRLTQSPTQTWHYHPEHIPANAKTAHELAHLLLQRPTTS